MNELPFVIGSIALGIFGAWLAGTYYDNRLYLWLGATLILLGALGFGATLHISTR